MACIHWLAMQGTEELCHALLRHVRSACAAPDNIWLALRLVAAMGPHVSWLVSHPALVQCTVCMLLRYVLPDICQHVWQSMVVHILLDKQSCSRLV